MTWVLTLCETALMALIPLLIGFAIDGLLNGDTTALVHLAAVLAGLIVISVIRRIYDTRVFGTIRVELGKALAGRSDGIPVSTLNARLGMGSELVGFLEEEVPALMNSAVQLIISLIVLFAFHPVLSYAALAAGVLMIAIYGGFHRRFYRLNADYNHQTEKQVGILETKIPRRHSVPSEETAPDRGQAIGHGSLRLRCHFHGAAGIHRVQSVVCGNQHRDHRGHNFLHHQLFMGVR